MRRDFPDSFGPTKELKTRSFVEVILEMVKYIQPYSKKMAIQKAVFSDFSANVSLTIQDAKINSMTKNLGQKTN